MREMVLNHASLLAPGSDRGTISTWLKDVAVGMGQLVSEGVVQSGLRMAHSAHDIRCLADYSYFDACTALRQMGHRDEHLFLMRMAAKWPLLIDVGEEVRDRFLTCQERKLPDRDGEPLVLCALNDWIAVGFPSDQIWDCDRLTIDFEELIPDDTFEQTSECIDQLTRSHHARGIGDRHRNLLRIASDSKTLWEKRRELFPDLLFGPDVEDNLLKNAAQLSTIKGKLIDLDLSARDWQETGGSAPTWRMNVTPESSRVKNNPKLLDERRFRSQTGDTVLFEWHARFGSGGRIHLRFDPASHEVEIGYIGKHLPLD